MIYSIKNILVAFDFTDISLVAAKVAIAIASRQNATLHLLNVVNVSVLLTM